MRRLPKWIAQARPTRKPDLRGSSADDRSPPGGRSTGNSACSVTEDCKMVELTSSEPYRTEAFPVRRLSSAGSGRFIIGSASGYGVSFVLPTLLFFAVFKYGPMMWAIELSFNSYDMVSVPHFVGLDNYRALAIEPDLPGNPDQHLCLHRGLDRPDHSHRSGAGARHQYRYSRGAPLHDGNVPHQPDADHRRLPGLALSAASLWTGEPDPAAAWIWPHRLADQLSRRRCRPSSW